MDVMVHVGVVVGRRSVGGVRCRWVVDWMWKKDGRKGLDFGGNVASYIHLLNSNSRKLNLY